MKRKLFGVVPIWLVITLLVVGIAAAAFLLQANLAVTGDALELSVVVTTPWACFVTAGPGTCTPSGASTLSPGFDIDSYDDDTEVLLFGSLQNQGNGAVDVACDLSSLLADPIITAAAEEGEEMECGGSIGAGVIVTTEFSAALGGATPGSSLAGGEIVIDFTPQ